VDDWYIDEMIDHLIKDKTMYAELRMTFISPRWITATDPVEANKKNHEQWRANSLKRVKCINKAIKKKVEQLKEPETDFSFGLKFIYSAPRSVSSESMREHLRNCIELKIRFPDLICGKSPFIGNQHFI
jgi:adenosine deaminase CECR1